MTSTDYILKQAMIAIQKLMLMSDLVLEADVHKLKRERRQVSEQSNGETDGVHKTVKM